MPRYGIAPQLSSHWYPDGWAPDESDRDDCCFACRRGTKEIGHFPCANPDCHCHEQDTETRGINRSGDVDHPVEGLGREDKLGPQTGAEGVRK